MIKYVKLKIDEEENKIILNNNQIKFFNAIFNDDFTLKDSMYTEFAFFGGFRCGKSFICQLAAWILATTVKNLRLLYVRKTWDQLDISVIEQMNNDFLKYKQHTYLTGKHEARFHFTGSKILYRAFDIDTNILSSQYDGIFVCQSEDIKPDLFKQLKGRLSGTILSKRLLVVEGNPSNTYVKARYKDSKSEELKKKQIFFMQGDSFDNQKNLPADYIQSLLDDYPQSWINRYVYGGWEQLDEMALSEFRERIHIIDPIGIETFSLFKIQQGMDYGWKNETAILWCYTDYDGNLIIFDEWGGSEKFCEDISKNALKYGKFQISADYSMKAPGKDGKSIWSDLVKLGLLLVNCNKQQARNIQIINKLFKHRKLFVTRNCIKTIQQIKNTKWKTVKLGAEIDHPEEIIDKDTDYFDAFLYVISGIENSRTQTPQEKGYKNTLDYHVKRMDQDSQEIYSDG